MRTDVFEWRPPSTRAREDRWSEDVVLAGAVESYRDCLGLDYQIVRRPDRQNRSSPEVDAVAEVTGAPPIAFEHTRLETFAGQIEDDAKVQTLLGSFQRDLATGLPHGLACNIPIHAFVKGTDWADIRTRIGTFLRQIANDVRPGDQSYAIDGVPFPLHVSYEPGLRIPFRFWRFAPSQSAISRDLLLSMEKALLHKRARLREYASNGYRTVLILDSADMSLSSWVEPYQAFLVANGTVGTDHLSDVLFAWTEEQYRIHYFGFKGDPEFLDRLNPPNLKLGQHRLAAWEATLAE